MTRRNKDVGDWGEQQACNFLVQHGFRIVERNYHTTMGEIDVIAVKGDDFYFIEVKTRYSTELATDDSITRSKKIRLQKAVRAYCFARNVVDKGIVLAGLIIEIRKLSKTLGIRFYAMV